MKISLSILISLGCIGVSLLVLTSRSVEFSKGASCLLFIGILALLEAVFWNFFAARLTTRQRIVMVFGVFFGGIGLIIAAIVALVMLFGLNC